MTKPDGRNTKPDVKPPTKPPKLSADAAIGKTFYFDHEGFYNDAGAFPRRSPWRERRWWPAECQWKSRSGLSSRYQHLLCALQQRNFQCMSAYGLWKGPLGMGCMVQQIHGLSFPLRFWISELDFLHLGVPGILGLAEVLDLSTPVTRTSLERCSEAETQQIQNFGLFLCFRSTPSDTITTQNRWSPSLMVHAVPNK